MLSPFSRIEGVVIDWSEESVAEVERRATCPSGTLRKTNLIFDLFEIRASRDEVRRFYRTVGRVEAAEGQAASE